MSTTGFKFSTTRKSKDGTYHHVTETSIKNTVPKAENPGDNQVDEVHFKIDENGKVIVSVKNAYTLGLVEFLEKKTETFKKKVKNEAGEIVQEEKTRKVNKYNTKPFLYIQGTDGNLYLYIGEGKKANGKMTEGWANLSAYARNLMLPKLFVDITVPSEAVFAIDSEATAFYPTQVDGTGKQTQSDEALYGYKLTFVELAVKLAGDSKSVEPVVKTTVVDEDIF